MQASLRQGTNQQGNNRGKRICQGQISLGQDEKHRKILAPVHGVVDNIANRRSRVRISILPLRGRRGKRPGMTNFKALKIQKF